MLLGWIGFLSMMQFFFAHNMFMYYHALHVIFFFFPVPYVSIVTLFLFSLSLTLSLSLSFSLLIMSPKKSVPSKSLIRRGSSSSSFPLDFVRFRDEKALSDFFENFFDQEIHSEC